MPRQRKPKSGSSLLKTSKSATVGSSRGQRSGFSNKSAVNSASYSTAVTGSIVSDMKPRYSFYGKGLTDFGMEAQFPVGDISGNTVTSTRIRLYNSSGTGLSYQFSQPNSGDYIDYSVYYLASMFARWNYASMEFVYSPQCATSLSDKLMFAFSRNTNDPAITQGSASDTRLRALTSEKYSKAFAPWEPWTLKIDANDIKSGNRDFMTSIPGSLDTVAKVEWTQELNGVFTVLGPQQTVAAPAAYGTLWIRARINLFDFGPNILALITLNPPKDIPNYEFHEGKGYLTLNGFKTPQQAQLDRSLRFIGDGRSELFRKVWLQLMIIDSNERKEREKTLLNRRLLIDTLDETDSVSAFPPPPSLRRETAAYYSRLPVGEAACLPRQ